MQVSICITTFNEDRTIGDLLVSLLGQTVKPHEIVIVDAESTDQTAKIIRYYRKKDKRIKLIVSRCSRAKGRNLSVQRAESDVVAMTDAGCIAQEDWLEKITEPFKDKKVEIVAGFYDMEISTPLKKAFSIFLGVTPRNFDPSFMPSTRSVAFRKSAYQKAGGFPESMTDTAEDTLFNVNATRNGIPIFRVKRARVIWKLPDGFRDYTNKIYNYALGDVRSGVWTRIAGVSTHNVRILRKILAYVAGLVLFALGSISPLFGQLFFVLSVLYIINAFRKVYIEYEEILPGFWGIFVQFLTDLASIVGFFTGLLPSSSEYRLRKTFLDK